MKLDGITGESKDSKHGGEIDVLAWSWGVSNSGSFHTGGGGGAGKANFQDLSFTKYIDSSSNALLLSCASGTHIATANLVVRKAGGTAPLEYLKINLTEVIVTSVSTGGSGGEDRLTENVSLNFAEIAYEYYQQKKDGTGEAAKEFKWKIESNEQG
jgi:type VI secretion system secreted protein Hcp